MRLVYLSPVPWHSFPQRPHELVRFFNLRTKGEVLWVDPYPTRLPVLSDLTTQRPSSTTTAWEIPKWLRVVKARALPVEPLPLAAALNRIFFKRILAEVDAFATRETVIGIGKPSALALDLLATRSFAWSFYDGMDNFPAFYRGISQRAMQAKEREVASSTSVVLASSSQLHARLSAYAKDVRLVLNACASDRFPTARARKHKLGTKIRVGYVGTLAQWFDWDLVIAFAKECRACEFQLIGPMHNAIPPRLPSNIAILPPLAHARAVEAMAEFDVGLIPFLQTELTECVDPIKYYEYRALGVPIVSTRFGQMLLRGESDGVILAQPGEGMNQVLNRALDLPITIGDMQKFRAGNSWNARFDDAGMFGTATYS